MRLERLTWPQAEQYFNENDMVILAIGSIECHGTHMPLGTDTLIPNRILELIEEKSDVLIAPTIPYGATQYLSPFPGTINLGPDGLYTVVSKVVEGLWSHGARKIIMLNGHGGGDNGIVEALHPYLCGTYEGFSASDIRTSVDNHHLVFAAEKSRLEGSVVTLTDYIDSL